MTEGEFVEAALSNSNNRILLERLAALNLPDAWLVSGSLFQTAWNLKTGHAPEHGIKDYDVFIFEPDTSWEAEDGAIKRLHGVTADMGIDIELRNQARVHLWYEEKFGSPYPPLARATDGIDRFLMPCAQVGMRANDNRFDVYAPKGFGDIDVMIVRPNDTIANFQVARYAEKAERWKALWPELTVMPATPRSPRPAPVASCG